MACPQKYSLTGLFLLGFSLHADGSQVIGSAWVCVEFACVWGFVCPWVRGQVRAGSSSGSYITSPDSQDGVLGSWVVGGWRTGRVEEELSTRAYWQRDFCTSWHVCVLRRVLIATLCGCVWVCVFAAPYSCVIWNVCVCGSVPVKAVTLHGHGGQTHMHSCRDFAPVFPLTLCFCPATTAGMRGRSGAYSSSATPTSSSSPPSFSLCFSHSD